MSAVFSIMGIWDKGIGRRPGFTIPWAMLEPHEAQALKNHNQTLKRLAERGGLGACEAMAVLEDRPWHRMDANEAHRMLKDLVAKQEAAK